MLILATTTVLGLSLSVPTAPRITSRSVAVSMEATRDAAPGLYSSALLFDCDGVLVETEELHRIACNQAFAEFGLEVGAARLDSTSSQETRTRTYIQRHLLYSVYWHLAPLRVSHDCRTAASSASRRSGVMRCRRG